MNKKYIAIIASLIVVAVAIGFLAKTWYKGNQNRKGQTLMADWRANKWPDEIKQTEERVKSRQTVNEAPNAVIIDLKPYINTKLTDAPLNFKGQKANNLSELPVGKNIYGGVPFDVEGSIQLMGEWLRHYHKTYPAKVENISINKRFAKLHLLHGAASARDNTFGMTVAKLVLHYEDGSTREINIVSGDHVFDWWNPLYTTGIDERMRKTAPGTELAWTGSNAHIKKWMPDLSLSLYKSSFENPQPALTVASLDYVSTLTEVCPFLVGLTIE